MANKKVSPGCSWKWEFLLFNAKTGYTAMCCDHPGARVSLNELQINSKALINQPSMIADRQNMLNGESLPHCQGCYRHITENPNIGGTLYDNHNTVETSNGLKSMGIMLNTTCLYTCVYCSEHFSSSWYSDVDKSGSYKLFDKEIHKLSMLDKVQNKISIKDSNRSKYYDALDNLIFSETGDNLSTLRIGGGEPLLYEGLFDFINNLHQLKPNTVIEIYTGLGVSETLFEAFINTITPIKSSIKIILSQEGFDKQAEFMRYGTNWSKWQGMAKTLKEQGYHIEFNSVLNNMSLFTISDFLKWKNSSIFKDSIVRIQPLVEPDFMSLKTLNKALHEELLHTLLEISRSGDPSRFIDASKYVPTYKKFERENLQVYLIEFAKRRNLDINVMPNKFLEFLNG